MPRLFQSLNLPTLTAYAPFLFVFLWSTGFVGAKLGLPYADALTFLLVRYLLVIALMGLLVFCTRAPWPSDPWQFLHIGVSGVLVHAVYLGGVFLSLKHGLPAGITALLVGMQPLLTACGVGWWLGEKVSSKQRWGLFFGFIGVVFVLAHKISEVDLRTLGALLIPAIVALCAMTVGTLYQKRFCPSFDLRTGSIIQFVPSALLTAIAAAASEEMHIEWSPAFIFSLSWVVLVLSFGAISLLNLLIRQGSAVKVASLFYLTPPATALIAWMVFGETLNTLALLGMALAVYGVYLARSSQARDEVNEAEAA
ncbi:MAG: DMT family transporter [Pseudomonadota bacterium]